MRRGEGHWRIEERRGEEAERVREAEVGREAKRKKGEEREGHR